MKNSGKTENQKAVAKKKAPTKKAPKKAATKLPVNQENIAKRNANLKPFQKGQSGNPNGRPKKLPQLDVLLAEVLGEEKDGFTAAQAILMKVRQKAIGGDMRAAEIILDRAYGKAKQSVEVTEKTIIVETSEDDD